MTLARRLWIYQSTRFPLKKNLPLLAIFSAASVAVSAHLADRPLPGPGAFATAFALAAILFFQMRAADEWKDRDIDRLYRPERPIPQGVVALRTILVLALALALPAVALAAWAGVAGLLALVWVWLVAMTAEFGVRDWLTRRPVVYLLSHMAILPLIDLLLTGIEWIAATPAPGLVWFLALSVFNGCVLEIGRKTWAPEQERPGVESYSGLWGPRRAAAVWAGAVAVSAVMLLGLGAALGAPLTFAGLALLGTLMAAGAAHRFRSAPTAPAAGRLDLVSDLWILLCYAAAGGLPLAGDLP